MRISVIDFMVILIYDNCGTEGGIQILTEPHTYLLWCRGQFRILSRVGSQQNRVRTRNGRQDQYQAYGKRQRNEQ
jgi:hypothetical protein